MVGPQRPLGGGSGRAVLAEDAVEALLEEHAHRIAFVPESGLQADEQIAELPAEHEQRGAVGELPPRRRPPRALELVQPAFPPDVIIDRNSKVNIRIGAEVGGVAFEQLLPELVDAGRDLHVVAFVLL